MFFGKDRQPFPRLKILSFLFAFFCKEWYTVVNPKRERKGTQMEILVVVDMQNDFIDGALGTKEARSILPRVVERVRAFPGRVLYTRDTHEPDYLESQEGRNLPVPHCIRGTAGWALHPQIEALRKEQPIDKPTFGSVGLGQVLQAANREQPISSVTLVGLCTDICVISNALLLKAFLPEVKIAVDASCCAGVTPESHLQALEAMKVCQIHIENDPANSSILSDAHASGETL